MCKLCADITMQLPQTVVKELDVLYNSMAQKIWAGNITDTGMHNATSLYSFKLMRKGLFEAAGGDFTTIKQDTALYNRMARAELDLLQFACFKNHWLVAEGATLKSMMGKNEFETLFKQSFNRSYLTQFEAEIAHAKSVGEAIKRYSDEEYFAAQGFDWREYHTLQDERVRDEHRVWNNIKLPIEHPFWRTHYPPNGYNCRCYATTDFEGPEFAPLPADLKKYPIPKEFAKNFGESGRPFSGPNSHKYLAGMDMTDKRPLFISINRLKDHLLAYYDATPQGVKGRILVHPLLTEAELEQNTLQATRIVSGKKTTIKLHPTVDDIRGFRNPDASINGELSEFKAPIGNLIKTVTGAITEAGKQGAVVAYIYISASHYNKEALIHALSRAGGQPESQKSIREIVVQIEGVDKDIRVKRNEVRGFDFSILP